MKDTERTVRALGWFSIGLGLAEMIAPQTVTKAIGMKDHRELPALGTTGLIRGLFMLAQPQNPTWLWSRVIGDVRHLSMLSRQVKADNLRQERAIAAAIAIAGVGALSLLCAHQVSSEQD